MTPKQEAFARSAVETGNYAEAYRRHYKTDGWSDGAVWNEASRLAKHPEVSLLMQQLRQEAQEKHEVTIDTITKMLKEDHELARSLDQPSAAVSASMGLAKLHGLIVDKVRASVSREPDDLSDADLAAIATGSRTTPSAQARSSQDSDTVH